MTARWRQTPSPLWGYWRLPASGPSLRGSASATGTKDTIMVAPHDAFLRQLSARMLSTTRHLGHHLVEIEAVLARSTRRPVFSAVPEAARKRSSVTASSWLPVA